jgi:hypothetical protein
MPLFACGPVDLGTFAIVYEIVRKLVDLIMVGRYYGFQEDIDPHASTRDLRITSSIIKYI